jgi:hypothetical protein
LNNKWVVVGKDGFLRTSDNLTNWAVHDIVTENWFYGVAYGNGTYVAVGQNGAVYASTDGTTFELQESGTPSHLWSVAYGNGKFVAVGSLGSVITSEDGISWTGENQQNQPFSSGSVIFRDGQFISYYTSGRVYLSSDGLSWNNVSAPIAGAISSTAISDTIMVAVGNAGIILSADLPPKKHLVVNIEGLGEVTLNPEGSPYTHLTQVTLTPVPHEDFAFSTWSGDASGAANPLVVTMDSDKTITANFVLSVTGYTLWKYTQFTAEEREDDEISGPQANPDGDGLTNLEEYLRGTLPKEANFENGIEIDTISINEIEYLVIRYERNKGVQGVEQRVELADDLDNWDFGNLLTDIHSVEDNGDGTEKVTVRILEPFSDITKLFARLVLIE